MTLTPDSGRPGVMMLDTENVFAYFGWMPADLLWISVARRLGKPVHNRKEPLTAERAVERIAKNQKWAAELRWDFNFGNEYKLHRKGHLPFISLMNWSADVAKTHLKTISFGFASNKSVVGLQDVLKRYKIEQPFVDDTEDAADKALLQRLCEIENQYRVYIFGGRDWRVLDGVAERVKSNSWDGYRFAFVFPADARASRSACEGDESHYGKPLNGHPGNLKVDTHGNFFTYIDVIHRKMTKSRRTDYSNPALRTTASRTLPAGPPWAQFALSALMGELLAPTSPAFGKAWIASVKASPKYRTHATALSRRLTAATKIDRSMTELRALLAGDATSPTWPVWCAAALRLPEVLYDVASGRTAEPTGPLGAADRLAKIWLDSVL